MKTLTSTLALLIAVSLSSSAMAQQGRGQTRAVIQGGQAQAYVNPGNNNNHPKLGFTGQMINGYGMKILWVQPGSIAQRAGLEPGDILMRINGTKITSAWQYGQLLENAAIYNGGRLTLKVRNVRYDWGYNVPKFVNVHADLYTSGPIAAYQSQGGGAPIQALRRNK